MGKQETPPTLAARVAHIRELLPNLSRRTLSRIAGLSTSMVGAIERGERTKLDGATGESLAKACGVSLDWLLRGHGAMPKAKATAEHLARGWGALPPPGKSGPKPRGATP